MLKKLPESLGRALRDQRAGFKNLVIRRLLELRDVSQLHVSSSAFENMAPIPVQYTADGIGCSPPLEWHGVPPESGCVAVIVEDADSPTPKPLVHAITVNGSGDGSLERGALPSLDHDGTGVATGLNSYLQHRWLPPDPPPGHGPHHYAFQVFALRESPTFSYGLGRHELVGAILARTIAAGCLVGIYERMQRQRVDQSEAAVEEAPRDLPVNA